MDIWTAARVGNIEALHWHLAAGTDVNADDVGWTPLHSAAMRGQKEVANLLISKGAKIDVPSKSEWAPLHRSAWEGHREFSEILIKRGANLDATIASGLHYQDKTVLDIAVMQSHDEIADLLRKHGGKSGAEYSIHVAAEMGNIEAVKQHLAAGVDVNDGVLGWTPLHTAATKEIAELLIATGADVNAKNSDGKTPLDYTERIFAQSARKLREIKATKKEVAGLLRKASPLDQCSACKGTVNRSDKECPHCGEPNPSL